MAEVEAVKEPDKIKLISYQLSVKTSFWTATGRHLGSRS